MEAPAHPSFRESTEHIPVLSHDFFSRFELPGDFFIIGRDEIAVLRLRQEQAVPLGRAEMFENGFQQ